MHKITKLPTQAFIKEWLSYDADTGNFVWIKEPRTIGNKLGKIAGTKRKRGEILIKLPGHTQLLAHRLAWMYFYGVDPPAEIDHIDLNPNNNAIANLRLATRSQQKMNRTVQSNNKCGLKGAYYHACRRGKKWRSQIKVGKVFIFLGYFATPEEAHVAYGKAALFYYGEFARVA